MKHSFCSFYLVKIDKIVLCRGRGGRGGRGGLFGLFVRVWLK
jgi:hypothetical protein